MMLLSLLLITSGGRGDPYTLNIDVKKPTWSCIVYQVRLIIPNTSGSIDTLYADYNERLNSHEIWQITFRNWKCGTYQILSQAYITSFVGGQPLIDPGLHTVKITYELRPYERYIMRTHNRIANTRFGRFYKMRPFTTIDFCNNPFKTILLSSYLTKGFVENE